MDAASELARAYGRRTGFRARFVETGQSARASRRERWRLDLVREALRWGEPCVLADPSGLAGWGIPLMRNAVLTGGIVVEGVCLESADPAATSRGVREACRLLLEMAVESNLTNAALLRLRREESARESERAAAIHALKERLHDDIRSLYLREEPGLLAAIKRGERPAAREIINRVLVGIYHAARKRPNLLKSLALELVVIMSRAAVEAGASPDEVLGGNFESATALARLESEEDISAWLCHMLGHVDRRRDGLPRTQFYTAADADHGRHDAARARALPVHHRRGARPGRRA